jgi:Lrp/AsnC family transcriptional regulator, leucine-responsive regulatory protein
MAPRSNLDPVDARLLALLQADGRRSFAELAGEVGLSAPSVHERVKKLEARGVITRYAALVDPAGAGFPLLAFVWLTQAPGTAGADLTGTFEAIPEIEECHHIAGEADYLLKIRARDTADLERVVLTLQTTQHVFTTETSVVFSSAFERRPLPTVETAGRTGT